MVTFAARNELVDPETTGDYIRASQASKHLPGRPHVNTVLRHMIYGVTVRGRRIYLRSVKVGTKRLTKLEWIVEFLAAMNPSNPGCGIDDSERCTAESDAETARRCEALGI